MLQSATFARASSLASKRFGCFFFIHLNPFFLYIARLSMPHAPLQSLNSSAIRSRERIEAEKFYLLEICKALPSSAISSASSAVAAVSSELHPRFSELVTQHGLPIAASDAASVTLAASLAEVAVSILVHPVTRVVSEDCTGHTEVQRSLFGEEGLMLLLRFA